MAKELGSIVKGIKKVALAAAAVVALGVSSNSFGAVLVSFGAEQAVPLPASIQYDSAALAEAGGAIGDGVENVATGLVIETQFLIGGLPGGTQNLAAGTTTFADVTMDLTGFAALGPAVTTAMGPVTLYSQQLATGNFVFTAKGKTDVLLAGKIEDAVISGTKTAGGVFSAKVTFESGAIYNAMVANWEKQGELSWSLLDISPALGATSTPSGLVLNSFTANVLGQFSSTPIPEPASLSLLALAGLGLAARRRTR